MQPVNESATGKADTCMGKGIKPRFTLLDRKGGYLQRLFRSSAERRPPGDAGH